MVGARWRARPLALLALLALAVGEAAAQDAGEADGAGIGVASMLGHSLIASAAAIAGFAVVFPIDYVRKSSEFRRLDKGPLFAVPAFFATLPKVDFTSPKVFDEFTHRALLFAPRVAIKLAIFGLLRGHGEAPLGKVITGGLVAGIATSLYSFPFRRVEMDLALSSKTPFGDLVAAILAKVDAEGILAVYRGLAATLPFAIVHNVLLFVIFEVIAKAVHDAVLPTFFLAGPLAVAGASILSAPLDALRLAIWNNPFDFHTFFYRDSKRRVVIDPHWSMLRDHFLAVLDEWTAPGILNMFGHAHIRVANSSLAVALFFQHLIISDT